MVTSREISRRLAFCLLLAIGAILAPPAAAQTGAPVLLHDIAGSPPANTDTFLRELTPFKDQVAFLDPVHNGPMGIWVSDGTGPGTRLVHLGCQTDDCEGLPEILGTVNGHLLFSSPGEEQFHPLHLWTSDGSRGGTVPLTPAQPDLTVGYLNEGAPMVVTSTAFYFLLCPENRCELWQSDGTPTGTRMAVRYDGPGTLNGLVLAGTRLYSTAFAGNSGRLWVYDTKTGGSALLTAESAAVQFLTAAGGKVFFVALAADPAAGRELWVSDGTAAGTRALTQFEVFDPFADMQWMKAIGERVYFVANDVHHGYELWRSDGTVQGTMRMSDFGFFDALADLKPIDVAEAGNKILFMAKDGLTATRLWISDGRPESTAPFNLCGSTACDLVQGFNEPLIQIGTRVFYSGNVGLWSTDGTVAGTHRFYSTSSPCSPFCTTEYIFQAVQGRLVFVGADAAHGIELWSSDGTGPGTRRLTDVPAGQPVAATVAGTGGATWFVASGRYGNELWVTRGAETRLVADLTTLSGGSDPKQLTAAGDRLFFAACDGLTRSIWASAGTPETTAPVPGTESSCLGNFFPLMAAGGRLFLLQQDDNQIFQIWTTDGGVPLPLTRFTTAQDSPVPGGVDFQGRLLFPAVVAGQLGLWTSDGTPQGTAKTIDLPADVGSIEDLRVAGNEVYFSAFGQQGLALWRTDGTAAGTRKVAADLRARSAFVRLGTQVLFAAESDGDMGLWATNGTSAHLVKAQVGGHDDPPQELTVYQGNLYFFAPGSRGWSLWRSDGTAEGTVEVSAFAGAPTFGFAPPLRFGLTVFAGRLVFAADDGVHGQELWTSDGTAAGTRLVLDLFPGLGPAIRDGLTAANGKLYFAGNDGVHGVEMWESDGTAAGTRLVRDLAPDGASSLPAALTLAGDHLFFAADDNLTGREPWSLPLGGPAGCRPSSTRLCLSGGRYQVEASWLTAQGQSGTGTAVALSADTGYFWFFSASNVEAIVKVLDGQGVNGHVWVFYGALSNVEYHLTVTDTQTGLTRRYFNPLGQLASVGDTHAFGPLGASAANPRPAVATAAASPLPLISERPGRAATVPCQASAQTLCLSNGRFAVSVAWKDFQGHTGKGTAVPLSTDTGSFWFFNAANVELVVKALDGRPVNNHFWLFYGALSNVEYTLTVTDTQTGTTKTYTNPSGRFASVADTLAF
jgi:ELWxxDGT repeat protein